MGIGDIHLPGTEQYTAVRLAYCNKRKQTEFSTIFSAYGNYEKNFSSFQITYLRNV